MRRRDRFNQLGYRKIRYRNKNYIYKSLKNQHGKSIKKLVVVEETIIKKIIFLRDEKIMLDVNLAELYGVETRVLKQAVRRNRSNFPNDFMFELTEEEIETVVLQNVIPNKKFLGGSTPFGFTETGVAMLSSVLKKCVSLRNEYCYYENFYSIEKSGSKL